MNESGMVDVVFLLVSVRRIDFLGRMIQEIRLIRSLL